MGKYLDILARKAAVEAKARTESVYDINDKSDQRSEPAEAPHSFGRICRFGRTLAALESRCPDRVDLERWHLAIEDSRRFLAQWGEQAERLGWTVRELFGLHEIPPNAAPTYQRLSRYDCTGLVWLLQGSTVVVLTDTAAAIKMPTGSVVTYRKHNKPAFGPVGDSTDDFLSQ